MESEKLFEKAFHAYRDPRSQAYRDGARSCLRFHCEEAGPYVLAEMMPYALGTAEADAWFAGVAEGHAIWRRHVDELVDERHVLDQLRLEYDEGGTNEA